MSTRHEKAQAFLESLAADQPKLPFEPTLLPELFAGTSKESNSSANDIAALVNRSQGLAAQVLRRANSAYYGLRSEVSSLTRAIQVLGLDEVRGIVLSLGLADAFKGLKLPAFFPLRELWEHQVLTAIIARELARFFNQHAPALAGSAETRATPDELYAAGLLHDLGKPIIASRCPEDCLGIQDLMDKEKLLFFQAEELYWGLDHSVVGARVLAYWQLPDRLTELVGWHHAPQLAEKKYEYGARLLAAANTLATRVDEFAAGAVPPLHPETVSFLPPGLDATALPSAIAPCFDLDKLRGMTAWITEK